MLDEQNIKTEFRRKTTAIVESIVPQCSRDVNASKQGQKGDTSSMSSEVDLHLPAGIIFDIHQASERSHTVFHGDSGNRRER